MVAILTRLNKLPNTRAAEKRMVAVLELVASFFSRREPSVLETGIRDFRRCYILHC